MTHVITLTVFLLSCSAAFAERYIPVFTASGLQVVLATAEPGDRIHLLNRVPLVPDFGYYLGTTSGTPESPIILEGQGLEYAYLTVEDSQQAVLTIFADNWILKNFSISGGNWGIDLEGNNNVIEHVDFQTSVYENLLMRSTSSHNTVQNCTFSDVAQYGIRIGDRNSKHEDNILIDNVFQSNGSRAIIQIDGNHETSGDYIANNMFQISGVVVNFILQEGGNDFRYDNNSGNLANSVGFLISGGQRNEFRGNHCGSVGYPGYCIQQGSFANDTRVYADNICNQCQAVANVPMIDLVYRV